MDDDRSAKLKRDIEIFRLFEDLVVEHHRQFTELQKLYDTETYLPELRRAIQYFRGRYIR